MLYKYIDQWKKVNSGSIKLSSSMVAADSSIDAPPSPYPPKRYCDITGLEVRSYRNGLAYLYFCPGFHSAPTPPTGHSLLPQSA